MLLRNYIEGDYEITQYTGGGSVRNRLSNEIVAEYTNYWNRDGVHPETQRQLDLINEKLGVDLSSIENK